MQAVRLCYHQQVEGSQEGLDSQGYLRVVRSNGIINAENVVKLVIIVWVAQTHAKELQILSHAILLVKKFPYVDRGNAVLASS